eukprot:1910056-Amphidinium_carterae.1
MADLVSRAHLLPYAYRAMSPRAERRCKYATIQEESGKSTRCLACALGAWFWWLSAEGRCLFALLCAIVGV